MTTISTRKFPGRTQAWNVIVNNTQVGVVRQKEDGTFYGIRFGRVYGYYDSKVQATDAVVTSINHPNVFNPSTPNICKGCAGPKWLHPLER